MLRVPGVDAGDGNDGSGVAVSTSGVAVGEGTGVGFVIDAITDGVGVGVVVGVNMTGAALVREAVGWTAASLLGSTAEGAGVAEDGAD